MGLLDTLQGDANKAAVSAANAAADSLAARPFKVVLSIDSDTRIWLTVVVLGVFFGAALLRKR